MAIENETADQVVRMVLQGSEVVLRLSGEAAMKVAQMIYNALKGDLTTKGRATLWEFLRSGKAQNMFTIPDSHLKAFTLASKKFGFPFVVLKDKTVKDGNINILVYASDAPKVDRVVENLNINVKSIEVRPEIVTESGKLVDAFNHKMQVPLELIDGIPDTPKNNKRLLAELQKFAAKIKHQGPQVIEPVRLLSKSNGRYEIIPGQGSKRIMALRLAGYTTAVADIMIPEEKALQAKADRPSQERKETSKTEAVFEEKVPESKEESQTVNPTMARTSRSPASGQDLEKKSRTEKSIASMIEPESRPSVREKLKECKKVADEQNTGKALAETVQKLAPKHTPDPR